MEECSALQILRRNHRAWSLLAALSGLAGLGVTLSLPLQPAGKALLALVVAGFSGLGVFYSVQSFRERRPFVEKLCSACGDVLYWPRKASMTCRLGSVLLCYTYATNRYYAVMPEEVYDSPRGSPWTPTDYYCVKLLGGRVEKLPGGIRLYTGEFEALADEAWRFIRGRGRVAYAGAQVDPVRLARIAVEGPRGG